MSSKRFAIVRNILPVPISCGNSLAYLMPFDDFSHFLIVISCSIVTWMKPASERIIRNRRQCKYWPKTHSLCSLLICHSSDTVLTTYGSEFLKMPPDSYFMSWLNVKKKILLIVSKSFNSSESRTLANTWSRT